MLRVELIRDPCTAAMVASLYSVSRRTLHRHLKAEGRTFRQVANEVRCEIACTLLTKTNLSFSQIAEVLNYSEHGAFSRAFRRWSGQTPSAWRSSHRGLCEMAR
ncbi:helix-turn-helix transcriptional regulator [Microvirga sp. VF16]|nr:helix-turn-helix transcriptional regulator [Microvirga sp. VF16]